MNTLLSIYKVNIIPLLPSLPWTLLVPKTPKVTTHTDVLRFENIQEPVVKHKNSHAWFIGSLSGSYRGYSFYELIFFWFQRSRWKPYETNSLHVFIWSRSPDILLCVVKNTSTFSSLLCHNNWHKQTLLYRAECSKSARSRLGWRSATRSWVGDFSDLCLLAQHCVLVRCPLFRVFVFTEKLVVSLKWIQLKRVKDRSHGAIATAVFYWN